MQYVEKEIRQRSVFGALVRKEIGRFTSSANYMLNCGLGILFLPVAGILMLIKGREIGEILGRVFGISGGQDLIAVVICAGPCLIASMNNLAAPAVSLEGSSLWIPQSLPVSSKTVLRAKAAAQLVVSGIPMLAAVVLCAVGLPSSPAVKVLLIVLPLIFTAFLAVYGTTIGVRMPLLNWTNEIAPIKQGGAVTVTIFSSWGMCVVMGGLYLLFGHRIGTVPYLLIWTAGFALAALLLLRWLDTRGAAAFTAL